MPAHQRPNETNSPHKWAPDFEIASRRSPRWQRLVKYTANYRFEQQYQANGDERGLLLVKKTGALKMAVNHRQQTARAPLAHALPDK